MWGITYKQRGKQNRANAGVMAGTETGDQAVVANNHNDT
jgi:hypothetical protein